MQLTEPLCVGLWDRAADAELGICIPVPEQDKRVATNMLYRARQTANDPRHADISLVTPGPHPNEIWLCKKTVSLL